MSGVIVIPMKYTYYLVPIYPLLHEMNLDVARCLVIIRVVSRLDRSNFVYVKLLQQFSLLILLQFYFATKSLTDFVTFSKCNKIAY